MKQITYTIRGLVDEAMIPATKISCESLAGVHSIHIFSVDEENGRLEILLDGEPTEELESALYSIMDAKGLELVTPPTVEPCRKTGIRQDTATRSGIQTYTQARQ